MIFLIITDLEQRHVIRALGYNFEWLLSRVADMCGLTPMELLTGGKQRNIPVKFLTTSGAGRPTAVGTQDDVRKTDLVDRMRQ